MAYGIKRVNDDPKKRERDIPMKVEAIMKKGYYYLGIGMLGNHFKGTMPAIGEKKLYDYKIGFV